MLQQSLVGWEALETDLLEAANLDQQAAQLGERVRSATQVVVDAILDLLDVGVFRLFAASKCWRSFSYQQAMQTCGQLHCLVQVMKAEKQKGAVNSHLCMKHELTCHHQSCTQVFCQSASNKGLLVCNRGRQSEGQTADSTAEALLFIKGLLVEGRATADAAATLKVLGHLAQEPKPGSEDAFVAVLQTATLQGMSLSVLATMVLNISDLKAETIFC